MARKRRDLAPEEKDLWRRVARSVRPMHRGLESRPEPESTLERAKEPGLNLDRSMDRPDGPRLVPAQPVKTGPAQKGPNARAGDPSPGPIDPTDLRGLRRGRRPIDAKIDLHGLYQDQAYRTLEGFFAAQRARGARVVIVVTGKGGKRRESSQDEGGMSAPGVLRRNASLWFTGPMARHVAAFHPAGPRHGGDGAFYVVLRKLERG